MVLIDAGGMKRAMVTASFLLAGAACTQAVPRKVFG
jgi:hypothetical protein